MRREACSRTVPDRNRSGRTSGERASLSPVFHNHRRWISDSPENGKPTRLAGLRHEPSYAKAVPGSTRGDPDAFQAGSTGAVDALDGLALRSLPESPTIRSSRRDHPPPAFRRGGRGEPGGTRAMGACEPGQGGNAAAISIAFMCPGEPPRLTPPPAEPYLSPIGGCVVGSIQDRGLSTPLPVHDIHPG